MKLWTREKGEPLAKELGVFAGNIGYGSHLKEYTEEEIGEKVRAFLEKYVLRCSYSWMYEDDDRDDGPSRGSGVAYQEISPERVIVEEGKVLGVSLIQIEYAHMSSSFRYIIRALYECEAPEASVHFEGCHCGSHTTEEGDARYSLHLRCEIPEGAKRYGAHDDFLGEPHMY